MTEEDERDVNLAPEYWLFGDIDRYINIDNILSRL